MNELNKRKLYIDGNGDVQAAETTIPSGGTGFMPQTNEDSVNVTFKGATTLKNALDMIDSSTQALQNLVGESFSPDIDYNVGDRVNYQGRFYKFTDNHPAGEWTGSDVEEYTLDIPIPVIPSSEGTYLLYGSNYQGKTTYNWKKEFDIDKYSYGIGWTKNGNTPIAVGSDSILKAMPCHKALRAAVTKTVIDGDVVVSEANGTITYKARQVFQYWLDPTNWNKTINGEDSFLTSATNDNYDGLLNIMIYNENIWYKSFNNVASQFDHENSGDWNEVRISPIPLDSSWKLLKAGYSSFGKLQAMTINGLTRAYSYGNITDRANDPSMVQMQRSELGTWNNNYTKSFPIVNIPRQTFHEYAVNAGGHMMSYDEYKILFYWMPAIEFCTFAIEANDTYSTKYGLDNADTPVVSRANVKNNIGNVGYPMLYTDTHCLIGYPITTVHNFLPNGYTNELASGTGWKRYYVPNAAADATAWSIQPIVRWRGFEISRGIMNNVYGVWGVVSTADPSIESIKIFATNNRSLWNNNLPVNNYESATPVHPDIRYCGTQTGRNYISEFDLGNSAEIVPIVGSNNKGDFSWAANYTNIAANPLIVSLGGDVGDYFRAGPGGFLSNLPVYYANSNIGARWRVNDDEYDTIYN